MDFLKDLSSRWITLSHLGDNNIIYGYEQSLDVLRPISEVTLGDKVISGNFIGDVIDIYLGDVDNDLGLKGIKVRISDPVNYSNGDNSTYYSDKVFVFGKSDLEGILVDTSHVNLVDVSTIKVLKVNSGTYKDLISQSIEKRNSFDYVDPSKVLFKDKDEDDGAGG